MAKAQPTTKITHRNTATNNLDGDFFSRKSTPSLTQRKFSPPKFHSLQYISLFGGLSRRKTFFAQKFFRFFRLRILTNDFCRAIITKSCGGIAQLGERLNGIQEVRSSILLVSTIFLCLSLRGCNGLDGGRRVMVSEPGGHRPVSKVKLLLT